MYLTSQRFKDAVYAGTRSVKGRVIFDITDTTINGDVSGINTSLQSFLSDEQQLIDKKRDYTYNFATFEQDRFLLDGRFSFPDDNNANNGQLGYLSNVISDANGDFTPFQSILFTFGINHSSIGVTISFDDINGEYASDFSVIAYDHLNNIIETVDIINNNLSQIVVTGQFYEYRKLELVIKKWAIPNRRARVLEVDFGVVKVYTGTTLVKMDLMDEMDITNMTTPSSEFNFTIINKNREFNILNPDGFYKYLQERQQILPEIGVVVNGVPQYIPLGEFFLKEWISDEGSLTTSFSSGNVLDLMSSYMYENLVAKTSYSLYDMLEDIFSVCDITDYEIDNSLDLILTNGVVKNKNCREILQLILMAGMANVYVDRMGILKVKQITLTVPQDEITINDMFKEAKITLDPIIKSINVDYYSDIETFLTYTNNLGNSDGEIVNIKENTLINTLSQATNVANWLETQLSYRLKYETDWRGNPIYELSDNIKIHDVYGEDNNTLVTKINLQYSGGLRGTLNSRSVVL